jgi:hypothetical protein
MMNSDKSSFRKATIFALSISIPALLLVCTAITGRYSLMFVKNYYIQILAGFIAMYLFSELVGFRLKSYLYNYFWGGLYGITVFIIGSTIASITSTLVYLDFSLDYIWKPIYALSLFGAIPAFILGLIFTQFLRRIQARNTAEQGAAANP